MFCEEVSDHEHGASSRKAAGHGDRGKGETDQPEKQQQDATKDYQDTSARGPENLPAKTEERKGKTAEARQDKPGVQRTFERLAAEDEGEEGRQQNPKAQESEARPPWRLVESGVVPVNDGSNVLRRGRGLRFVAGELITAIADRLSAGNEMGAFRTALHGERAGLPDIL
jgi:hypothetical protein